MKSIFLVVFFITNTFYSFGQQKEEWFYLVAHSEEFFPVFEKENGALVYKGEDQKLKMALENYYFYF